MTTDPAVPPAPLAGSAPPDAPATSSQANPATPPAAEPDRWARLETATSTASTGTPDSLDPAPIGVESGTANASPSVPGTSPIPPMSEQKRLPAPTEIPAGTPVSDPATAQVTAAPVKEPLAPTRRWSVAERRRRRIQAALFLAMLGATVVMMIACGVIFYVKFVQK